MGLIIGLLTWKARKKTLSEREIKSIEQRLLIKDRQFILLSRRRLFIIVYMMFENLLIDSISKLLIWLIGFKEFLNVDKKIHFNDDDRLSWHLKSAL